MHPNIVPYKGDDVFYQVCPRRPHGYDGTPA